MSFDDLHSSLSASTGLGPATEIVDVELDVKLLVSLVEENQGIHADDSELLARLESADTMASGVEAKLDEILGKLDNLLSSYEPMGSGSDTRQQVTIPRSESSEHPPSEQ